jgi:predicted dehydrogenase
MTRVKIIGAGSIGNHLANAARRRNWQVTICDRDPAALRRTQDEIYPSRYGSWDGEIRLAEMDDVTSEAFDIVIVGTPPDSHIPIALRQLECAPPALLFLEKPLCPPSLEGCKELSDAAAATGCFVGVGYNHTLTRNTMLAEAWLSENPIGEIVTISALTREHWGGIFGAHPWLDGPHDSYLGFTARGGGALGEHSHAINIWQHFALLTGHGRVVEVQAMLDWVDKDGCRYDRIAQLNVRTESGLVGTIVQDVVTKPARKWLRLQGRDGYLEWEVGVDPTHDAIRTGLRDGEPELTLIEKTRPDDFLPEIDHMAALLEGPRDTSPVALERGIDTMLVIAAALRSSDEGRSVRIDPRRGFGLETLV